MEYKRACYGEVTHNISNSFLLGEFDNDFFRASVFKDLKGG